MKQALTKILNIVAPVVLPVTLLYEAIISKRQLYKKIIYFLGVLIFFGGIYYVSVRGVYDYTNQTLLEAGLTDKPVETDTRGPSMLPTLKESDKIMLSNPKKVGIGRGDIVTFTNEETENLAYLKRVIGLPNETIAIRNGNVWINGKPLKETYIYNNRPTFGNTYLEDCTEMKIPEGSYALFGDNRAMSWDSRAIGFVKGEDIFGVKKGEINIEFNSNQDELKSLDKTTPDPLKIVKLINEKRAQINANPLVTNSDINTAATKRAESVVSNFEAYKRGENTAEKFLESINYRYNLIHEYVTHGYLTDEEIVEQIFDNPEERDLFLSNKFTEVGVGVQEYTKNTCVIPVIEIIISWPSLATYDESIINGWANDEKNLVKSLSDLQSWIGFPEKDQNKIRELINVTSQMSVIASRIHTRMVNKEYLTAEDYSQIKIYNSTLLPKYNTLLKELFPSNVQGTSTEFIEEKESW